MGLILGALVHLDTRRVPQAALRGPALVVTNHRSPLDYLIVVRVCRACGQWPAMFAREDFFDPTASRYLLRLLGLIPASRGRNAPEGLRRATRLLDQGRLVAIAAEGGLVRPEDRASGVGPFRGGTGRLAAGGAEVVVLTITGADEAWPPGRRLPRAAPPWRRPTVVANAKRVPIDPDWSPVDASTAIRTTMVDLVNCPDVVGGTGRPIKDPCVAGPGSSGRSNRSR
jgi:1-acyl-sn-glycerol-3-phosphate acyltransferase